MISDAAGVLREMFRRADVLARIGGDEFAAFTFDADDPAAVRERLRHAVDAFNAGNGRPYRLSLSVGVAGYGPSAPCSLEQLLEQADAAMYREKRSKDSSRVPGRDRPSVGS
jgi:diguanylate cyclase (GGDEF)-like protein